MDKDFLRVMIPETMQKTGMGDSPEDYFEMGSRFMTAAQENPAAFAPAMYCYEVAAEAGHAVAQGAFASGLMSGMGVEKNMQQAEYWARKAAEQGDTGGMMGLGVCCFHNDDYDGAEEWLRKAGTYPGASEMLSQVSEMRKMLKK